MAYSPLGRGALTRHATLLQLARERGATPAQLALAWCLRLPDVVAIPKSAHAARIDENWQAGTWQLRPRGAGAARSRLSCSKGRDDERG